MQRAQTHVLRQNTNQALLEIRQSQLNYYTSFHITFGGQAALIGGFVYSGMTGITIDDHVEPLFHWIFWIFSSICMSAALHCVFTTILLQVLGPGLALSGPIGSVTKATTGLSKETNQVMVAYFVMCISFALSTLTSFWVVMDHIGAISCSIIFFISFYFWGKYSFRIYNRFSYSKAIEKSHMDMFDENKDEYNERSSNFQLVTPPESITQTQDKRSVGFSSTKGKEFFKSFGSNKISHNNKDKDVELSEVKILNAANSYILMEGYMGIQKISNAFLTNEEVVNWDRKYFVLTSNYKLLFFTSKKEFKNNENNLSNRNRPIELNNYECKVICNDETKEDYIFSFIPIEKGSKTWTLRLDLKEEYEMWMDSIQKSEKYRESFSLSAITHIN